MRGFSRAARPQIEAFHGLPGHWVKPFYKAFYDEPQSLTNRRFNFDKFRVYEIDLSNVRRVVPGCSKHRIIHVEHWRHIVETRPSW